jgi:hypothetical protein
MKKKFNAIIAANSAHVNRKNQEVIRRREEEQPIDERCEFYGEQSGITQ